MNGELLQRQRARVFTAYLVTNQANGKRYIGISGKAPGERWVEHLENARAGTGSALHCAIRKYGTAAFVVESLACALDWDAICACERTLIVQWGTRSPTGYNLTVGGDGVVGLPPEIRQRISKKNKGRKHTPEAKRRIGEAGRGRRHSPSSLAALRQAHLGKKLTTAHRKKLSQAKFGKKLPPRSALHAARISEGLRRAWVRRRAVVE